LEYELLEHYYLWRSLKQLGREQEATAIQETMQKFAPGLRVLQTQLGQQPATPHLPFLQADLADLADNLHHQAGPK
jgi:hypothetical protein